MYTKGILEDFFKTEAVFLKFVAFFLDPGLLVIPARYPHRCFLFSLADKSA